MRRNDEYIIVIRHCKDKTSKGKIVQTGLFKNRALQLKQEIQSRPSMEEYFVWAMTREEY